MTPEARDLEPRAQEATALLKALAHPARLLICCQLKDKEMSVSEIEQTLGVRQPRLSRELSKLRDEGLVETRREAKAIFYRLKDRRAQKMVEAICAVMLGRDIAQISTPSEAKPYLHHHSGYGVFARTNL